jgi:hypothetical protein
VVWLLLLAVALGVLAGFWLGALYGVLLVPVFIGLVVGVEEWRTRRRNSLGDRSVHFDENQHQFRNYTDALTRGVDVPTAVSDAPSRDSTPPDVRVDHGGAP